MNALKESVADPVWVLSTIQQDVVCSDYFAVDNMETSVQLTVATTIVYVAMHVVFSNNKQVRGENV